MTHNIIAEFACSLNDDGTFKQYQVVSGSVFNEEYNETLDSATILLSQVAAEDRLSNIKPYDYVRVYDESTYDETTETYSFDKLYLVDNFDEKENNIKEHIFAYTINLMSETKWLEKIQCPNLAITHEVNEDGTTTKKTIYQHIKQYMDLFVPKIKYSDGDTWSYEPLISYPTDTSGDFYKKFNITCADMAFTAPTLRQLLTTLMLQVGCIPVVKNRTLGFLDFQADTQDFGNGDYTINNTVNFIRRGLSSDSYANTLVNLSENVLDSENEVICETLCFRDKNSVLLKQTENLYLETSLPIYKINKCILRIPGRYYSTSISGLSANYGCIKGVWGNSVADFPSIYYGLCSVEDNIATVNFFIEDYDFENSSYYNVKIANNLIYFLGRYSNGSYYIISTQQFDDFVLNSSTTQSWGGFALEDSATFDVRYKTFTFSDLSSSIVGFFFSGYFENDEGTQKRFSFIKFDEDDSNVVKLTVNGISATGDYVYCAYYNFNFGGFRKWDITKLVVENSIRNLLDTNFTRMNTEMPVSDTSTWTIDTLSKYIYGTVGYSIGSTKIEGFSQVFNVGQSSPLGWLNYNYTYIENIINFMKYNIDIDEIDKKDLIARYFTFLPYLTASIIWYEHDGDEILELIPEHLLFAEDDDLEFEYYVPTNNSFAGTPLFTTCIFDIYYQPLNSFNLSYVKSIEDVDIPISQYDSNASGLTDFDRLSLHEQEQVDRIGNETLSISQRTDDFDDIQTFDNGPLVFMDDTNRSGSVESEDNGVEYIIFKRSYTVNNNCFNASYVGSKDAILKNYFTSIRTKYRAYQYVDYSQSVLRKERDTFYVRIASNYYNGDDRIWLGTINEKRSENLYYWIYDTTNSSDQEDSISYECEYAQGIVNVTSDGVSEQEEQSQAVKNSVSLITNQNSMGIIYEHIDNIGTGPYIEQITLDTNLGGIPQTWQIWDDEYRDAHTVMFVSYIDFYGQAISSSGEADIFSEQVIAIEQNPIVNTSYIQLWDSSYVIFAVVDDNTNSTGSYRRMQRTFYKDLAERINHTTQFIYYAPNDDVLFGEDFISGTPMVSRFDNSFNAIYGSTNFSIETKPHSQPDEDTEITGESSGNITINVANEITIKLVDSSASTTAYWIYEHIFEYGYSGLDDYEQLLFDIENVTITTSIAYSYFLIENIKSEHKIRCTVRTTYSNYGLFTFTIPYFYNSYVINTTDDNSIPILRVYWNDYDVIKLCNEDSDGNIIDIAVFKRLDEDAEYTDYYFTLNDTKTDYVLSEQDGILYRRYKVSMNTTDRTVENIYDED